MRLAPLLLACPLLLAACSSGDPDLTVYSGRSEDLVGPLLEQFEEETGISVEVRYAGSPELAATLLAEGADSPADVFFAQDPASLGAVAEDGLFSELPADLLASVPDEFSDRQGRWVGVSGRVRVAVVADAPGALSTEDDLTDPAWEGRFGIAPANGSFLAFVAAKILIDGEEATADWLDAIAGNDPQRFDSNSAIVAAVDNGDIDAGLVNHYYLLRLIAEEGSSGAVNVFIDPGGAGSLVMPAGAGIIAGSDNREDALSLLRYLLSDDAQEYFATETFEYPLVTGTSPDPSLPTLSAIDAPEIDLSQLAGVLDLASRLVSDAGLL